LQIGLFLFVFSVFGIQICDGIHTANRCFEFA